MQRYGFPFLIICACVAIAGPAVVDYIGTITLDVAATAITK